MNPKLNVSPPKPKDNKTRNRILLAIAVLFLSACIAISSATLSYLNGNEDIFNLAWICIRPFVYLGVVVAVWLFSRWVNEGFKKAEIERMDREAKQEEMMRHFAEIDENNRMYKMIVISTAAHLLATTKITAESALEEANLYVGELIETEERMRKQMEK